MARNTATAISEHCGVNRPPQLILLNGPPGPGKSTLARMVSDDRPLSLLLDIDEIWTNVGGWWEHEEAKTLARRLAVVMARAHLSAGFDVVVPQFLGRPEFIVTLEDVARDAEAVFVELLLQVPHGTLVRRFERRRQELASTPRVHPQDAIATTDAPQLLRVTIDSLDRMVSTRSRTVVVDAGGDLPATAAAVRAALHEHRSPVS